MRIAFFVMEYPPKRAILHYAVSDLCVFPSIYEPFGIVSLEVMSMEKPIVVGAKGVVGFREQVMPRARSKTAFTWMGETQWTLRGASKRYLRIRKEQKSGAKTVANEC